MLRSVGLVFLFALLSAIGCSSEDEPSGPYAPPGNGLAISDSAACDVLRNSHVERHNALNCGLLTLPICPGYIANQKQCTQYDEGTVQGCVAYIQRQETCEAVADWRCIIKPIGC